MKRTFLALATIFLIVTSAVASGPDLARGTQGFGYAFMFVPVTQLAYFYLPKTRTTRARASPICAATGAAASASRSSPRCWRGEPSIIRACW
jgi:hypothetical protein